MVPNLSLMPSLKISSCTSNSIARRNRIAASTYAAGTRSRSKTIPNQKGRVCAPEACMASWLPHRNSRASRKRGRATTSHSSDEWSPLCRMVRPLLTNRKFRVSPAVLWIVTKDYPARSICRAVRPDTWLFGTSRLRRILPPGRSGRPANYQLSFQIVVGAPSPLQFQYFLQRLKCNYPQTFPGNTDGGQRRASEESKRDIVDTHHRDVVGNLDAFFFECLHGSHRNEVASAEDHSGSLWLGKNGALGRGPRVDAIVALDDWERIQLSFVQSCDQSTPDGNRGAIVTWPGNDSRPAMTKCDHVFNGL